MAGWEVNVIQTLHFVPKALRIDQRHFSTQRVLRLHYAMRL